MTRRTQTHKTDRFGSLWGLLKNKSAQKVIGVVSAVFLAFGISGKVDRAHADVVTLQTKVDTLQNKVDDLDGIDKRLTHLHNVVTTTNTTAHHLEGVLDDILEFLNRDTHHH